LEKPGRYPLWSLNRDSIPEKMGKEKKAVKPDEEKKERAEGKEKRDLLEGETKM